MSSSTLSFTFVAEGVTRPEGIAEAPDGSIWASDKAGAAVQLRPDGSIRPVGSAGGEPNGINFLPDGRLLIANLQGTVQVLDPGTGAVDPLLTEVDGVPVTHANYVLADAEGFVWATESFRQSYRTREWAEQMRARPDGWLFVSRPDGSAEILAEGLSFANGLALSPDGAHLYVAETFSGRISRAEIRPGGGIGPLETVCVLADEIDEIDEGTTGHAAFPPGPDGMAFDESGALWVGIWNRNALFVVSPDGGTVTPHRFEPTVVDLGQPTNPVFTGPDRRDLLVGSILNRAVARTRVKVPGAPQPYRITTPAGR
jgi:gluconolactonase